MKIAYLLSSALAFTSISAFNTKSAIHFLRDVVDNASSDQKQAPITKNDNQSKQPNPGNSNGSNEKTEQVKKYIYNAIDQFLDAHPHVADLLIELYQDVNGESSGDSSNDQAKTSSDKRELGSGPIHPNDYKYRGNYYKSVTNKIHDYNKYINPKKHVLRHYAKKLINSS